MCFRAADYCMSATELNLSYALQNTLIPQIHSQSQYSSFWQIFLTTAIFAPLLAPLIWSKFWGLPKLITAFLLCLWQEAGTNITTKLSCISSPFFYWWWMVLPLSQETRKSQKSSPHPLFSTQMMYRLWLVSSSDITNEVTAHAPLEQKPLLVAPFFLGHLHF